MPFVIVQIVQGISASTFYINYEANAQSLKQAIAKTMVGVQPSNIKAMKINRCTTTGPCVDSEFNDFGRGSEFEKLVKAELAQVADKIIATYTVEVPSALTEYALFSQLLLASSGPEFDDHLHAFAQTNAAVDLYNVDSGPCVIMRNKTRPRGLRAEPEIESVTGEHLAGENLAGEGLSMEELCGVVALRVGMVSAALLMAAVLLYTQMHAVVPGGGKKDAPVSLGAQLCIV
jgi:hypothetical protein